MWETCVWSLGWKDPLEKGKATTPVFWPGESPGLCSPWGRKESDTTKRLSLTRSQLAQMVKNLPAMQETQVQSLGWEDPLEKSMATPSSILAWSIPWTEEPGRLQSVGLQRVKHDWATNTFTYLLCYCSDRNVSVKVVPILSKLCYCLTVSTPPSPPHPYHTFLVFYPTPWSSPGFAEKDWCSLTSSAPLHSPGCKCPFMGHTLGP